MACILPAAYTRNIPRGTKFSHELSPIFKKCSITNSLDGTDDILWTNVCDNTHDTHVEDDTYDDLPYL